MTTPTHGGIWTSVPLSGNSDVDAVLYGTRWGSTGAGTSATVTYSFPGVVPYTYPSYGEGEWSGYSPLNADQQNAFRMALQTWSQVANIQFTEIAESPFQVGDIRVAFSPKVDQGGFSGWAYLPGGAPEAGDVWLNTTLQTLSTATGQFETLVHELGHAIGLEHPFEGNVILPSNLDDIRYSVMSYTNADNLGVQGPSLLDIAAVQYLYGPNMSTGAGDNWYQFDGSPTNFYTLWDAAGTDTVAVSAASSINLNAGHFSSIGLSNGVQLTFAIAYGTTLENVQGSSQADVVEGNEVANDLSGQAGNDQLTGSAGADRLYGNQGDDILLGGTENDWQHGGQGNDTLYGNQGNDELYGGVAYDYLHGGQNDDLLVGGNGYSDIEDGTDTIYGGEGADRLFGNAGNDQLFGDNGNDSIHGGRGDDHLDGGAGDDHLAGGLGADILVGGAGADVFYIDENDTIADLEPIDQVLSLSDWVFT